MYTQMFIPNIYLNLFYSDAGWLEERSYRSLLHPAHTGIHHCSRLYKTSPPIQEENWRAVSVSIISHVLIISQCFEVNVSYKSRQHGDACAASCFNKLIEFCVHLVSGSQSAPRRRD